MKKLGFIGTGNLASSIIKGLMESDNDYSISAFDVLEEKLNTVSKEYGVVPRSIEKVIEYSDIIIMAVKPKDILKLLSGIKNTSIDGKLFISTAAGISLEVYEQSIAQAAFVRVMPNTSSAVLHSVTGLARGKNVTDEQVKAAEDIFLSIGKVLWIEDAKINALTAVSGSGPAYIYLFTEYMVKAGKKIGLTDEESQLLAVETVVGAGKMLAQSKKSPSELRAAVTSPNGTTYAALCSFSDAGLDEIILEAMKACKERAEEMEGEYTGANNKEGSN